MASAGAASNLDVVTAATSLASTAWVADASVSVVVVGQRTNKLTTLGHLSATSAAQIALRDLVAKMAARLRESEVIPYAPNTTVVTGQVMAIAASEVPMLASIEEATTDIANVPVFDPTPTNLRQARLAAIRAGVAQESAVFIQSLAANKVVARTKEVSVFVRKGVIDVPRDEGQLLLLGTNVAATILRGVAFFTDRATFQKVFGYLDELKAQAAATFDEVIGPLNIQNRDLMRSAATGSAVMLSKMASIQSKLDTYPEYRDAMTMSNLKVFVDAHPECGVQMVGEGDDAQFVFTNDPQNRFKILKLLDDDFLQSPLTKLEYEANSKGQPIG